MFNPLHLEVELWWRQIYASGCANEWQSGTELASLSAKKQPGNGQPQQYGTQRSRLKGKTILLRCRCPRGCALHARYAARNNRRLDRQLCPCPARATRQSAGIPSGPARSLAADRAHFTRRIETLQAEVHALQATNEGLETELLRGRRPAIRPRRSGRPRMLLAVT